MIGPSAEAFVDFIPVADMDVCYDSVRCKRLAAWLAFAAPAAAITCTRRVSDPPTRKEIEALGFA